YQTEMHLSSCVANVRCCPGLHRKANMEAAVTISDLPRTVSLQAGEQSLPKQWTSFFNLSCFAAVATGLVALACSAIGRSADSQEISTVEARMVAVDIPGASAISQVGTFLNAINMGACAAPIPKSFPSYIQPGAVLDPNRLLVGSRSNFGAPPAVG